MTNDEEKLGNTSRCTGVDATGKNILIVDDNVVNLQTTSDMLKITNATVSCCKTGRKCLDVLTKRHFDIIFLDHMMPEMDGIEVLHAAKVLPDNLCEDSVYVALTANVSDGAREMYLAEGFDEYLCKPIDSDRLMEIIKQYV